MARNAQDRTLTQLLLVARGCRAAIIKTRWQPPLQRLASSHARMLATALFRACASVANVTTSFARCRGWHASGAARWRYLLQIAAAMRAHLYVRAAAAAHRAVASNGRRTAGNGESSRRIAA
jgi:hypothetical protein